jgi:hypothetical protein
MKPSSAFLFIASFLLVASLVFGLSGCSHQEKKEPAKQPAAAEPAKVPAPTIKPTGPVSVDFDNVPLSDVAQFVTGITAKGFILNGSEQKPISWIEYNIGRDKLIDAFKTTLAAVDLVLKPANDAGTVFTVEKIEEMKVPYKLNFATSKRGTFFLLGATIYSKDKFPFPVKYDAGHWYAMVPKSTADQLAPSTPVTVNK